MYFGILCTKKVLKYLGIKNIKIICIELGKFV